MLIKTPVLVKVGNGDLFKQDLLYLSYDFSTFHYSG